LCIVFTGQMRSLRLFYSDSNYSKGQVVIASRESQYKILHFHHGGLNKLAEIFEDWNLFAKTREKVIHINYVSFELIMKFENNKQKLL